MKAWLFIKKNIQIGPKSWLDWIWKEKQARDLIILKMIFKIISDDLIIWLDEMNGKDNRKSYDPSIWISLDRIGSYDLIE